MLRILLIAATLAAAACSDGPRRLAEPSGPVFKLNPEAWAAASLTPGGGR